MENDTQETKITPAGDKPRQISAKSVAGASAVGLVVGGPLLGLAGFSFLAALTLFLVASPVFLLFSPLLLGAVLVLAGAMTGFGAAAAMSVVGFGSLVCAARQVGLSRGAVERMVGSVWLRMEEMVGWDSGRGYLQDKVEEDSSMADRES